jgi:hypothetical protein
MNTITMQITITDLDGSSVGVNVHTEPFTPSETPDNVGACWVGLCTAMTAYMRAHGAPDFNCLKIYREGGHE